MCPRPGGAAPVAQQLPGLLPGGEPPPGAHVPGGVSLQVTQQLPFSGQTIVSTLYPDKCPSAPWCTSSSTQCGQWSCQSSCSTDTVVAMVLRLGTLGTRAVMGTSVSRVVRMDTRRGAQRRPPSLPRSSPAAGESRVRRWSASGCPDTASTGG